MAERLYFNAGFHSKRSLKTTISLLLHSQRHFGVGVGLGVVVVDGALVVVAFVVVTLVVGLVVVGAVVCLVVGFGVVGVSGGM